MTRRTSRSPEKKVKEQEEMQVDAVEEEEDYVEEVDVVEEEEEEEEMQEEESSKLEEDSAAAPTKKRGRPKGSVAKKKVKPKKHVPEVDEDAPSDPEDFDEEGELKVNKDGYLLGGREYRFQTFTLPRHPTRLYLYSLDASKLLGFRDTYIFFLRNENVKRINGTEEDREHLNRIGILPTQLKNRPITLVSARNLFKVYGHKTVRRGRPVRDDYVCKGLQEPAPGTYNEENDLGFVDGIPRINEEEFDHTKIPSALEGGPFRRHGISIAGFANPGAYIQTVEEDLLEEPDHTQAFEPTGPASEQLVADAWMYKCALSSAEFNARLRAHRPCSFIDLHTNVEQIATGTQPCRVSVQVKTDEKDVDSKLKIDSDVVVNPKESSVWKTVSTLVDENKYPLAITKNQFQESLSVYPFRFQEGDEGTVLGAVQKVPPGAETRQVHDLPPTLMGAIPYKPELAITQVTIRKRGRPKKTDNDEDERVCVHCNEIDPPESSDSQIPKSVSLFCARCTSKNHPTCIEFDEKPSLVSKCLTYPWVCSNCKLCVTCQDAKDDDQLLFCDLCDRATHMYCLDPPLSKLPSGSWLCLQCAVCHSCKKKTSDVKHVLLPRSKGEDPSTELDVFLCSFCKPCLGQFEKDQFCPLCCETFGKDSDEPLAHCEKCARWIHVGCDATLTEDRFMELATSKQSKFVCLLCEPKRRERALDERVSLDQSKLVLVQRGDQVLYAPPLHERK